MPILKYLGWSIETKQKPSKNQFEISDFVVSIGGFILFTWLLMYIYYENEWSTIQLLFLFLGIFISTISLGGLFGRKLWAALLWGMFGLFLNWVFLVSFQLSEPLIIFLFSLQSLHSIYVLISLIQSDNQVKQTLSSK